MSAGPSHCPCLIVKCLSGSRIEDHLSAHVKKCPQFPMYNHTCERMICIYCQKQCQGWCKGTPICEFCYQKHGGLCTHCLYISRYSSGCN